jgi:L-ribulose-5-phosphate 3-epimerase
MNPLLFDRRRFLKTGGIAAAVWSLDFPAGVTGALAAPAQTRRLKKAVHLGMINGPKTVREKFQLAKELGYDGLEINRPDEVSVEELLQARDATGLEIASVIDAVHWRDRLSDPDPAVRARGVEGLKAALRDSRQLGCTSVLLVPAVVDAQVSYADAYRRSQEEIRKVLPWAREWGVSIALENVWNHFLLSPLEAARYVDEFNSPVVGWHLDVGNLVNYGWPEQWIRVLEKRILRVHVKEFSRVKRDQEGLWKGFNVELGEGDCNWPEVMKALDEVGYQGWLIAEVAGGDGNRLRDLARRMDRILAS